MHMDKAFANAAILLFKVLATNQTAETLLCHTLPTSLLVALILVGFYSHQSTLIKFVIIFWIIHIIDIIIHGLIREKQKLY